MVEEFFFLPSAIVVGDITEIRRTEAVKLSVKLLGGLSLIALVAIAVVTLTHSASADVNGTVFVTNLASNLTNEASPPTGRTNASTVYGTYNSNIVTGVGARDIVPLSDAFMITVVDADLNTTETVKDDNGSPAGYLYAITDAAATAGAGDVILVSNSGTANAGYVDVGDQFRIVLTDSTKPIIGDVSDIQLVKLKANSADATVDATPLVAGDVISGLRVDSIFNAGDGTSGNRPIITVSVIGPVTYSTGLRVVYPTSAVNTVTAKVKSVVDTVGTTVTLTETGRDTARFEGWVRVYEHSTASFVSNNAGCTLNASATTKCAGTGTPVATGGTPSTIAASAGPITITYTDPLTSTGSTAGAARVTTLAIDVTSPTATITSPSSGSESQNTRPSFTGNVTDNQSGLDKSKFELLIDRVAETTSANSTLVILPGNSNTTIGAFGGASDHRAVAAVDLSSVTNGVSTFPFSYNESADLPTNTPNPDHAVDFQVRVADLAGNYGYSDSDTSTGTVGVDATTGRHGNQPHVLRIDQVMPAFATSGGGKTGFGLNSSSTEIPNVRDSIKLTFDGKVKESSISASDFQVIFSGSGGTFVPASVTVKDAVVYLDLDVTIPSDNTPTVKLQGTIEDLAGNSTASGSVVAADYLAPVITVTQSGGSGNGTGSEGADQLTNGTMTITVSSDEALPSPPQVTVSELKYLVASGPTNPVATHSAVSGVALGGNSWSLVIAAAAVSGTRSVKVDATDGTTATSVGLTTVKAYTFDKEVAAHASTPITSTTQSNPFLTTDISGDQSSISVVSATLDGVDVTSSVVASENSKTFFFQPATALSNASHTYVLKVKDAAGNLKKITNTFDKADRSDFVVQLFAGWNSVSFPSSPLDSDINTVLSNTGVKQVVAYDATTPSQPWRIASKIGSAAYTSQTTPGLTSIAAGPGYWVETSNFEDQKVALEGPTGPGDARPGLATIPTGNGWNLVGVVDQSRSQTQSGNKNGTLTRPNAGGTGVNVTSATYFNTVNSGRAYTFDTVTSKFRALVSTDTVTIGSGIWVYISPQTNGQLPNIVP